MKNEVLEKEKILIYKTKDAIKIETILEEENIWLNQEQLVKLYDSSKSNISEHIKHIFSEKELETNQVVRKFRTTAKDGKNYNINYYNLEMIIAIGYRVKSSWGTDFRVWANKILKDYLIKGYNLNVERFKNNGNNPYFEELLEKIRDIRSSERFFGEKYLTFIQQVLITILKKKLQLIFSEQFKIKYIMQYLKIQLLR